MQFSYKTIVMVIIILCVLVTLIYLHPRLPGQQTVPIRIGFVSTLTGRASTAGVHARNGAMLAVEEINRKGGIHGRPIELIIRDDKANPNVALKVDQELIDANVVAIAGHLLSSMSVAAVPLMNKTKTLMVASASSTSELTGMDDSFIRLLTPVDKEASLLAEVSYYRFALRRIVVLYDLSNKDLSEAYEKYFRIAFQEAGGKIVRTIPFDTRKNFLAKSIAAEINSADPDGVFIAANAIYAALICQHFRAINQKAKIIDSAWGFTDPAFIQNGGRAVNGVYSITAFNAECQNPEFIRLKDALHKRFAAAPSLAMQLAYESIDVLGKALEETGNHSELKAVILAKKTFTGIDGEPIIFDRWGDPQRTFYLQEIRDGVIHTIDKVTPNNVKGRP